MKTLYFLIIFLPIIFCSCSGSDYDDDEEQPTIKQKIKAEKRELKSNFEYGKWSFDSQMYETSLRSFLKVIEIQYESEFSVFALGSNYVDSIKVFLLKQMDIITYHNSWGKKLLDKVSIAYVDSVNNAKNDSIKTAKDNEKREKELIERKWVYLDDFYDEDKLGNQSYYAYSTYYDINHLLYEGDSVCIMLKVGEYYPAYRYVSFNLITRQVHGIDASSYYGKAYNYVWDGDWWQDPNSDFAKALYRAVRK